MSPYLNQAFASSNNFKMQLLYIFTLIIATFASKLESQAEQILFNFDFDSILQAALSPQTSFTPPPPAQVVLVD